MELGMRKSYRALLTKAVNETNDLLKDENFNVRAAYIQLTKLKSVHASLNRANKNASALIADDQIEQECDKIVEYEEKGIVAIAQLEQRIQELQTSVHNEVDVDTLPVGATATSGGIEGSMVDEHHSQAADDEGILQQKMSVRLPKLDLIKFSGNFHEWPVFWEQFDSIINNNESLDDVSKLSYLKSVLIGNAAVTIQGLAFSKSSYINAVQLLKEEYGNKEKIVDSYIQKLLSIPPVKNRNDVSALRTLYNTTSKITKSLESLGIEPTSYGMMVKSIILKALPFSMCIEYNKKHAIRDQSDEANSGASVSSGGTNRTHSEYSYEDQISNILAFIKIDVDSVEQASILSDQKSNDRSYDSRNTRDYKPRHSYRKDTFKPTEAYTAAGLYTAVRETCLFCKSNDHVTSSCSKPLGLDQKKNILKSSGRCFRCTKANHSSRNCKSNIQCGKCRLKHATSMCDPNYVRNTNERRSTNEPRRESRVEATNEQREARNTGANSTTNLFTNSSFGEVYLQTACAEILSNNDSKAPQTFIRLVIDGGSQLTFIKECVSRTLNLPVIGTHKLSIMSFGNKQSPSRVCNRVELTLKGVNEYTPVTINAIEVPEICFDTLSPPSDKNPMLREFCSKHKLADIYPGHENNINVLPGISLLLGADYYWKVVTGEIKRLSDIQTAVNTHFGWTIHGTANEYGLSLNVNVANVYNVQCSFDINDNNAGDNIDIKRFWDLESIGIQCVEKTVKTNTETFVNNNIIFKNNRYSVLLPWINNEIKLDSNFNSAISRLKTLTNKLVRTEKLKEYDSAVREYFVNDCAELSPKITLTDKTYYMPHRPVYRDDKDTTKIRVVFDASAHSVGFSSLNDLLTPGENLVPLLLKILLNSRLGAVMLTADIENAFLQIEIEDIDRDSHSFLWYSKPIDDLTNLHEITKFRMKRVTFGVTCSPFLLAATIKKHLTEQPDSLKHTADIMLKSFYVDDLILSVNTVDEAYQIYSDGKEIMSKANMNLRKWESNSVPLKEMIYDESTNTHLTNDVNIKKILGISWYLKTDELNIDIEPVLKLCQNTTVTKRKVLQAVAKVYDPLGLLSPFIITAKILLQRIWVEKYDWDADLSEDLKVIWAKWCNELPKLKDFFLPRCIQLNTEFYVELHIFVDASPQAYGAVAYLRVAPITAQGDKELTLPRLELTGALCGARLQNFILTNLKITVSRCVLWTDSKIALHWIKGKPAKWKPYVSHRVQEIQKITVGDWKHCPGVENPADYLTRGVKAKQLIESETWRHGPHWLTNNKSEWPIDDDVTCPTDDLTLDVAIFTVQTITETKNNTDPLFSIETYSSFEKLLRITSYVLRAVKRFKGKHLENKRITASDMNKSELYWIKITQTQYFPKEVLALTSRKILERDSSILMLNPFLDDQGILRLGGRLQDSLLPYKTKHPIILPKKCPLSDLIILDMHLKTCHGGINMTLSQIRKHYWILQGRQRIKTVLQKCISCKRLKGKSGNEPFAPIPRARINAVSPFKVTGVDFAGPLYIFSNQGKRKVYVMLLTCATIRAVHLELVPDLTTESCIRALRRFISRREVPDTIYSDNAKTFKRTAMELTELSKLLQSESIQNLAIQQRIEWKFNVERASWWGGFWERLVKSVKDGLKLTLGRKLVDHDELQTILIEVEATINSRPLTYITNEAEDLLILTPTHFLLGENQTGFMIDPNNPEVKRSMILKTWKERNNILHKYWKRWSTDYLQQLRNAHVNVQVKSIGLKEGDIVLLHDQKLPRLHWKLARVTKTFIGRDSKVRACEIMTSNRTVLKRPIQLLYPLEVTAAGEDVEN